MNSYHNRPLMHSDIGSLCNTPLRTIKCRECGAESQTRARNKRYCDMECRRKAEARTGKRAR